MRGDAKQIRLIEELAANSWPAYIQQTLGAWRLRINSDETKRANSVFACGPFPEHEEWMGIVEDFYRRRSLSPCYYISQTSPAGLDGMLAAAGYRKTEACYTMIAHCRDLMNRSGMAEPFACEFAGEASREWILDFLRLEGYSPDSYEGYVHIFSAIGPKKAFVILRDQGEVVALGTAVAERGWAGLSNIIVDPQHRGRGAATALVRSLADWSWSNGADQLYLQVLQDNAPALSLYRKLGFTFMYEYHYRLLDT
ncbi:GNAT family N-acetyltransferase [Brevibacillus composti]|uniref:GNAT family N-acetyltransferase n=1 Tax=Brevibacillus composti TaxID=2796470 RepID=A0A7T5EHH5_9BACL|nr:GNAT family N-acetyltransferase [Brevibacillus composti]QQE72656.1 GNAT family N-acetyltransferase [Brevibacillus composti]QUO39734.1 GNAT family N-acetyltransferase [Brevibacillus composti]